MHVSASTSSNALWVWNHHPSDMHSDTLSAPNLTTSMLPNTLTLLTSP